MKWRHHRKWANMAGISPEISRFVDEIVDVVDEENLPNEYKEIIGKLSWKFAEEKGAKRGNSMLPAVIQHDIVTSHDASRRSQTRAQIATNITLQFLKSKGDDYVRAWRLHHALDFLWENRQLVASLDPMFQEFRTDHPELYSRSIEEFLRDNRMLLINDLRR